MIIVNEGIVKINAFKVEWNFNTLSKQFCNIFFKWINFINPSLTHNAILHLLMNCTNFPICNTRIQNNYEFENQTSIASCTQYAIPASKVMQKLTIVGPLTSKCNTHIGIMPKPHRT
jgi:hypothetical protein